MPRFFVDGSDGAVRDDRITITGEDARHISRSLRMKVGERLDVSDFSGMIYSCEISSFTEDSVELSVIERKLCESEPSVKVRIFQALPKGDKLDTVIQKCTELGAFDFTPVLTSRCISRPDDKSAKKKCERWQKISAEAAKQCGRGIIPAVNEVCSFDKALAQMSQCTLALVCYECEDGNSVRRHIESNLSRLTSGSTVAIFIGPEGGIAPEEAEKAQSAGIVTVSLGKRILRTETAPLFALSAVMLLTGNCE
ncbi:MAG: 16S rRNA (uracil(1498)-N(3))-methyltransferase [Clostridia bacterium]|nr:16S rRNA (uracil(1498)-N(3))-methyltransferase [Clostridia bacterium]